MRIHEYVETQDVVVSNQKTPQYVDFDHSEHFLPNQQK